MSSITFAGVKYKTFIPTICSHEVKSDSNNIHSVCMGKNVGDEVNSFFAVTYKPKNKSQAYPLTVYMILKWEPGNSGVTGKTKTFTMAIENQDQAYIMQGFGDQNDVQSLGGTLPDGQEFEAANFKLVIPSTL
jgi:hypothetical protein